MMFNTAPYTREYFIQIGKEPIIEKANQSGIISIDIEPPYYVISEDCIPLDFRKEIEHNKISEHDFMIISSLLDSLF